MAGSFNGRTTPPQIATNRSDRISWSLAVTSWANGSVLQVAKQPACFWYKTNFFCRKTWQSAPYLLLITALYATTRYVRLLAGARWLFEIYTEAIISFDFNNGTIAAGSQFPGVSIIFSAMHTPVKASHFQTNVVPRHCDRLVSFPSLPLEKFGSIASANVNAPDDNDGLWAEDYLVAQSFRYAVTKDEDVQSTINMLKSVKTLFNVRCCCCQLNYSSGK